MGFYLGIGGMLTFPDVKKILRVVEGIPLERLLLETDAPYLAPVPKRGERNDSRNLQYVAEKIAQIKGITAEEVARVTSENACRLFQIEL
jgi:TatD DNase family protein